MISEKLRRRVMVCSARLNFTKVPLADRRMINSSSSNIFHGAADGVTACSVLLYQIKFNRQLIAVLICAV